MHFASPIFLRAIGESRSGGGAETCDRRDAVHDGSRDLKVLGEGLSATWVVGSTPRTERGARVTPRSAAAAEVLLRKAAPELLHRSQRSEAVISGCRSDEERDERFCLSLSLSPLLLYA